MAEIADLRQRVEMRHAHLLLIEGVPWALTDEPELEAAGWWTYDDRRILGGLSVPETLSISLDLESGLLEEDTVEFSVLDIDGTIPQFFGGLSKTVQRLGQRLLAGSDPIVAPLIGADQDTLPADEGGYLGTEAFGPEGQRNYYSHIPWANMPGQDHPIADEPLPVFTTRATGPLIVEGRRVALYRILFDPDLGIWPNWGDQVTAATSGGWSPMLWWGMLLQDGSVEGHTWSFQVRGPGSWLRRSLASRMPTTWFPVTSAVTFADSERKVLISFYKKENVGLSYTFATDGSTYSVPDGSPETVANYLGGAIAAVAVAVGPDGVWTDDVPTAGAEGVINFDLSGCTIATLSDCAVSARVDITLHVRVWRLLGYDPLFNPGSLDGPQPLFIKSGNQGYYLGVFSTVQPGKDPFAYDGDFAYDGNGIPRQYTPLYPGGTTVLQGLGNQVVGLEVDDQADIYLEGQGARPPEIGQIEGNNTDATRWWAFRGPLQREGQEEPEDTVQVARCSWVDFGGGKILEDSSGITRGLRIDAFLDARLYGMDFEPLTLYGWASNNGAEDDEGKIVASPLAMFGLYDSRPDKVIDTIIRTLCSTGTGQWGAKDVADANILDHAADWFSEGVNSTGLDFPAQDVELYDLSLQIPVEMIDLASFAAVAEALPGGSDGALAFGKIAIQGTSIQSEDLFKALLSSRGWAFGLKRGKFGLFAPYLGSESFFEEGKDFDVTESDLAGVAGDPGSVRITTELRPAPPFDRVTLKHTGNPTESWLDGQIEYSSKARDPGARARSGTRTRDVAGPDLIAKQWFAGDENGLVDPMLIQGWSKEFRDLWEVQIASWLSRPHRLVKGLKVARHIAQDLYPSAIVRLTNRWVANSYGGYGVTGAYGRVLSVVHDTTSCAADIEVLLEAASPNALRWAPILRVVDDVEDSLERYDPSERKFYVQSWGGSQPPLSAFVKPPSLDAPDEPALAYVLSFDGHEWSRTGAILVESVDTVGGSITYASPGSFVNFRDRQYAVIVMAPTDDPDQVEWVRVLYARHTDLPADPSTPKLPV